MDSNATLLHATVCDDLDVLEPKIPDLPTSRAFHTLKPAFSVLYRVVQQKPSSIQVVMEDVCMEKECNANGRKYKCSQVLYIHIL